jgi:Flp pilus assembly protein TadG
MWLSGRGCPADGPHDRVPRDRGQATVELALATPVLCLLLLGIVQLAVVVRDQLAVVESARVAARAAAVSANPPAAAAGAVSNSAGLQMHIVTLVDASSVTVTVSATSITDIPLIGVLLPDVEVSGRATMLLEPP